MEAHLIQNCSNTIQMWQKIYFALIQIQMNRSLQIIGHGTAAVLSLGVPKLVAISLPPTLGINYGEMSFQSNLNCDRKGVSEMSPEVWTMHDRRHG